MKKWLIGGIIVGAAVSLGLIFMFWNFSVKNSIIEKQGQAEIKWANVESAYHPCGTCKMGDISDPMAVVDKFTKVIGIEKLRVVDSSIFPQITNGNLNGPTIMVSEKASDHILGKDPMPRANENVWVHPNWKDQQR